MANKNTSTLMAMVDCNIVSREALSLAVTPPPQGPRHVPVPHSEVVDCMETALSDHGFQIERLRLAMGGKHVGTDDKTYENTSLFGVADIVPVEVDPDNPADDEYGTSIGFKSNNMMKHSILLKGGGHVFVCDNLMMSGEDVVMRKLHTTNLNLLEALSESLGAWLNSQRKFEQAVEVLRNERVNDEKAKAVLFDLFDKNILPLKALRPTAETYFSPKDEWTDITGNKDTLWGVHNAVTRVLRPYPLHKQMSYSGAATQALVATATQ